MNASGIYHFRATELPIPDRTIEFSNDGGITWTDLAQAGLPNSGGTNYLGWYGVWEIDGVISTYNSFEADRGIYQWNSALATWDFVPSTAASIENWDGMTHMQFLDGEIYANWAYNGTWQVGGVVGLEESTLTDNDLKLYPNPTNNLLNIQSSEKVERLAIVDLGGNLVYEKTQPSESVDVNHLKSGVYLVIIETTNSTQTTKIIKQ